MCNELRQDSSSDIQRWTQREHKSIERHSIDVGMAGNQIQKLDDIRDEEPVSERKLVEEVLKSAQVGGRFGGSLTITGV